MKKSILFIINNLEAGGVQRSLIDLLNLIHNSFDITLFVINYRGIYVDRIPETIKIIKGDNYDLLPELSSNACRVKGNLFYILHVIIVAWSKFFGRKIPAWCICKLSKSLVGKFDIGISYAQPSNSKNCISLTNEYLLYKCKAHKKIMFLHSDYSKYDGNTPYSRWLYSKADRIACVSQSVLDTFVSILPETKRKSMVVFNACDGDSIKRMADESPVLYKKKTIISVSRLGPEKGLLRCIPIIKRLIEEGYVFEWHIVGDGFERIKIEKKINECGMEKTIYLKGQQSNPYRFMKNASFLFLPSFHEAAPMVYHEAATLGIPVLTTNTLSAVELVERQNLGVVCENYESSIYEMLKKSLDCDFKYNASFSYEKINNLVCSQFSQLVN